MGSVPARAVSLARIIALLLICTVYVYAGSGLTSSEPSTEGALSANEIMAWRSALDTQRALVADNRRAIAAATAVMKERVAEVQAKVIAIDAATTALMATPGIRAKTHPNNASNDDRTVAASPLADEPSATRLASMLDQAIGDLDEREQQLRVLDNLLLDYNTQPRGRPVRRGWISSSYGERTDPFTGGPDDHKGVDIAGQIGTAVVAVADGLVTWSGPREGYGKTVEVTHGQGLVTRYAHNDENLVAVGDVVHRGQVIARLGETGRTTGPHVHFEVLRQQRAVDPMKYMR